MRDTASTVWRGNADLIQAGRDHAIYIDANMLPYTGKENILMTWSGLAKAPAKGTNKE
jgi:hypothetical protein